MTEVKEITCDSTAHARVIFLKTLNGSVRHNTHSRCITKADKGRGSQEAAGMWSPCLLLWCDRISIKLQLTGKSRLIIQFYHMTRRREIPWDFKALIRPFRHRKVGVGRVSNNDKLYSCLVYFNSITITKLNDYYALLLRSTEATLVSSITGLK